MSSGKKSDKPGGTEAPGKRPHATIDAKAERVQETAQRPGNSDEADGDGDSGAASEVKGDATAAAAATSGGGGNDGAPLAGQGRRNGGSSFLTLLGAGLLGGVVAVALGFLGLWSFRDQLPYVSQSTAEDIRQAQSEIQARVTALDSRSDEARAALSDRISSLETRIKAMERPDEATMSQLAERVAALEERIAQSDTDDSPAGVELADMDQRLTALSKAVQSIRQSLEDLRARSTQDAAEGMAALKQRVARLSDTVRSVQGSLEDLRAQVSEQAGERLSAIDRRVSKLNETVLSVRASVNALQAESEKQAVRARAAALAMALADLRQALDRGKAFATELKAVRQLSPEPVEADTLAANAKKGVPTRDLLRERFPRYANEALEAIDEPSGSSVIAQFVDSARSVVDVRPVGEVEGEGPSAVIARIEQRLADGDLAAVVDAAEALSGKAAEALQPWMAQVEARINAEKEMDALESEAKAAIRS